MQNVLSLVYQDILAKDFANVEQVLGKLRKYQEKNAGTSLPSSHKVAAERLYNSVPFATILFMINLTMGFLSLLCVIILTTQHKKLAPAVVTDRLAPWIMSLSFIALTFCLALRWIISGTVPMSNGYETMLVMAWFIMAVSLAVFRRFRILLTFGFILSGLFLLVSHIGQMNPQISHIMPVLASPLLSIHVSVTMMSFALLSFTFICGITALSFFFIGHKNELYIERMKTLQALSRLFLYPAIALLGMGIFLGAIWANISWGTYWGWDPKEVWALITFMVYAAALHTRLLPSLQRPLARMS